jgi:predicted SAM-dependent methyltransferase
MHLLVVLQTHSRADSQQYLGVRAPSERRYTGADKKETAKRCVRSLIHSLNHCFRNAPDVEITLKIFDDHSDETYLASLQKDTEKALFQVELTLLETTGIRESISTCYEYGKSYGRDLVYFAQDDYLYEETAILEMIAMFWDASKKIGNYVAIYPFNDPYRYRPENIVPVRIVQSGKRHWRTSFQTASCFMLHHRTLMKEYDLFRAFTEHAIDSKMEDDTINKLFQERGYFLFTPIPSLAFHMQYETERDPFIDYRPLWNTFADVKAEDDPAKLFAGDTPILLNIGAGSEPLNIAALANHKELRYDNDETSNPDILGDIASMNMIPAQSVDVLWASHIIEHVFWGEIPGVFGEIKRILKKDGCAILITPNLGSLGPYMEDRIDETVYTTSAGPIAPLDMLYGYRGFTSRGMTGMMHKIGFNARLLHTALNTCGLTNNRIYKTPFEIIAVVGAHPELEKIFGELYGSIPEIAYGA